MLKKLMKYELIAQARLLIPMLLSVIAAGILSAVLLTVNARLPYQDSPVGGVMQSSTLLLAILLIVAVFAACFVIFFLLIQRYYKNFFTDEGYLTFTLPVTPGQHLMAKLLAACVWSIAAMAALCIALFFLLFFGSAEEGLFNRALWVDFSCAIRQLWRGGVAGIGGWQMGALTAEFLLLLLVSLPSGLITFYYAITQGCTSVRKNRVLASVGIYFAANLVIQMVRNLITILASLPWIPNLFTDYPDRLAPSVTAFLHVALWCNILVYAAVAVVGFLLCRRLLTRKLNLE